MHLNPFLLFCDVVVKVDSACDALCYLLLQFYYYVDTRLIGFLLDGCAREAYFVKISFFFFSRLRCVLARFN